MNLIKKIISQQHAIYFILGFTFIFSIIYSFYHRIEPAVDARAYDNIALNLISGNGFKEDKNTPFSKDLSIQRAGPAYEFFLAGIYWLFDHHYEAVWLIQAILHTLSAWLIFLSARYLFAERGYLSGLIAAAIFGLHPDLIEIAAMLMTETLYLFFIILFIYLFIHLFQRPQSYFINALLNISLAIGFLSRPTLLFFIPILIFFFIWRRAWKQIILSLALLIVILAPWSTRNFIVYNQFIPATLIGEYNIWVGNTPYASGGQLAGGFNPFDDYIKNNSYFTVRGAARQAFRAFIYEHPVSFIKLTLIRTVRYFSLIRPMGFWFYQSGLSQLLFVTGSATAIAILFVTGFSGMAVAADEKKSLYYYLIAFALTAPIPLLITVVQSRYRFQIYPFLALFSGYFFSRWQDLKQRRHNLMVIIVTAGILSVTLVDIVLNLDKVLARFSSFI